MEKINLHLVLLFFFFQIHINAQSNVFFPMENGVWEEAYFGFAGGPFPTYLVTCGDTLINDEKYAKLYDIAIDSAGNIINEIYNGASKTGADEVHFIPAGSQEGYLLYDFSLEMGESIELVTMFGGMRTLTVQNNTLINTNDGITRRMIIFDQHPLPEFWIEGIGSSRGVLTRGISGVTDFDPFMNCFKYEDVLIWSNETTMPECNFSYTEMCASTTKVASYPFADQIKMKVNSNPMQTEMGIEIEGFERLHSPEIRIYDLRGQLIRKIMELNEEKFTFFRNNLNAGMYVFELFDTKTTFAIRKKIIVL